ncbi:glycoside hydrolase family 3 C-terminal domain-containing protein [Arachidicoccus terrestris]|uniref:glycoside hydrolase family 3 C-terminal domain-containing protein n=1 Tax=Arachidicoccus terrestris TaxID=2875539 RepID=UPI001CC4A4B1|nr:glycoside hydrolase family 3 C-terminal domain-containing protein [Arachidicoccus terrestris]UAY56960.1 glycoside hydrolase family 3 C-terminal domain-containing protein [Arachidicoccus terrestris]
MKLSRYCHSIFLTVLLLGFLSVSSMAQEQAYKYPFQDPSLTFEQRVKDLVGRLTLKEKVALMQNDAKSVPRLGIPSYNWWNECLHGVARDGVATVFPQAIGMAAMWNIPLMHEIATAISTEARAKHEEHVRNGERGIYQGLDFWTPNINIFRDPRWGRGQETYGEDPFLTARTGVAFVKGLQGDDPRYFKTIATAKHFAIHSGSEYNRHWFNAVVSKQDMYDTYLPAFEALVKQGHVYSLMGAYNSVDGVPACANRYLLDTVLRGKWGFKGYVVSDCGAITDIYQGHKYVATKDQAAAAAVNAGCDLTCGNEYIALEEAVRKGEITEAQIDISVSRLLLALFKLGMFDSKESVAYKNIPFSENNSDPHSVLSKKAALESMVLLQNKNNFLPLAASVKTIAVVGPFADDTAVLLGNYNGVPTKPITFLQGIRQAAGSHTKVITGNFIKGPDKDYADDAHKRDSIRLLVESCANADVVVFCGGLTPAVEGEESGVDKKGFFHGDRTTLDLPDVQQEALKALKASGKKVVLVLTNGGMLAVNWASEHLDGILEAWYPGQNGGAAVADILFGQYNPAGRLPVTFYRSLNDLPEFEDYSMKGRTYRYFKGKVLYPFGYGLSYARFSYADMRLSDPSVSASDSLTVYVKVSNDSKIAGDEVVQVYGCAKNIPQYRPVKTLVGFKRVHLKAGEVKEVTLRVAAASLREYDVQKGDYTVYKGNYELFAGGSSADRAQTVHLSIQ